MSPHSKIMTRPAFAAPMASSLSTATVAISTSSFVSRRPQAAATGAGAGTPAPRWTMGKTAKFGIFSPAVIVTKWVVGDKRLNKIRGKAISLHSQVITAFCDFTGTGPKMRTSLIRQAKTNGDTLGFLS